MKIGFIGLGLIGGSIAKCIRKRNNTDDILIAYDQDTKPARANLALALDHHVIDEIVTDFNQAFSDCDMIFLCAPVHINVSYLKQLKPIIKKDCIITDVGSVKTPIHQAVIELGLTSNFIGGHPMAGSEHSGFESSNETLLENAYYILTASDDVSKDKMECITSYVMMTHAIPIVLDYHQHDNITAVISHVPHIIASLLVDLVKESDDESQHMKLLAAGGFKDITRIASASPEMWKSVCMTNTDCIYKSLLKLKHSLETVMNALKDSDFDSIYNLFSESGSYREQIPNSKGMILPFYELFLDISDEPGAIAIIATLLGSNQINIKNIGIVHNREWEDGVLRIEFYDDTARVKAKKVLISHNYTIYERT